jgi:hypothetical protein
VNGAVALVVPAKSSQDAYRANPAFVRVKMDGVDVELVGGDSTAELLAIARTLRPRTS